MNYSPNSSMAIPWRSAVTTMGSISARVHQLVSEPAIQHHHNFYCVDQQPYRNMDHQQPNSDPKQENRHQVSSVSNNYHQHSTRSGNSGFKKANLDINHQVSPHRASSHLRIPHKEGEAIRSEFQIRNHFHQKSVRSESISTRSEFLDLNQFQSDLNFMHQNKSDFITNSDKGVYVQNRIIHRVQGERNGAFSDLYSVWKPSPLEAKKHFRVEDVEELTWKLLDLQDEGNFNEYLLAFVELVFPIERLVECCNEEVLLNELLQLFVGGLREEFIFYMNKSKPTTLFEAINSAVYYEEMLQQRKVEEGDGIAVAVVEEQIPFGNNNLSLTTPKPSSNGNSDFFNWDRVKIGYCDGTSFSSEGYNKAAGLYFRVQRIWLTALEDLMSTSLREPLSVRPHPFTRPRPPPKPPPKPQLQPPPITSPLSTPFLPFRHFSTPNNSQINFLQLQKFSFYLYPKLRNICTRITQSRRGSHISFKQAWETQKNQKNPLRHFVKQLVGMSSWDHDFEEAHAELHPKLRSFKFQHLRREPKNSSTEKTKWIDGCDPREVASPLQHRRLVVASPTWKEKGSLKNLVGKQWKLVKNSQARSRDAIDFGLDGVDGDQQLLFVDGGKNLDIAIWSRERIDVVDNWTWP